MRNYTVCAPSHMFAPAQNSFWVRPCLHHPPTKVRTTRLCTKGHILNNHQTSIHFRIRCLIFSSSHAWFYSLSHVSPQRIGSGAPHLEDLANTINGLGSGTPLPPRVLSQRIPLQNQWEFFLSRPSYAHVHPFFFAFFNVICSTEK
jgi:hypothetical protein